MNSVGKLLRWNYVWNPLMKLNSVCVVGVEHPGFYCQSKIPKTDENKEAKPKRDILFWQLKNLLFLEREIISSIGNTAFKHHFFIFLKLKVDMHFKTAYTETSDMLEWISVTH